MARAFKCDSCGEYCDEEPMMLHLIPPKMHDKTLHYDLCPFCAEEVIKVLDREKVFGDLD